MRNVPFLLAVLAGLATAGCGGSDTTPAPAPTTEKPAVAEVAPAARQEAPGLLVNIIPDPPTADGCIKALVGGSRQATYRWEVNGLEVTGQATNVLCEGFRRGDQVRVIVAADKGSGSGSATIANAPPRITEVTVNADDIARHAAIEVKPAVIDVDGDPVTLRYQWFINNAADPFLTESILPADRYARGDAVRFTIGASDGTAESKLYQSETLTVPNAVPQIESRPPQQFQALEYSYQVKASDADGDKLVYALAKAPRGMTIDAGSGLITWPLTGVQPGAYPLKIVVRDPVGAEAFQEFTLTLGAPK